MNNLSLIFLSILFSSLVLGSPGPVLEIPNLDNLKPTCDSNQSKKIDQLKPNSCSLLFSGNIVTRSLDPISQILPYLRFQSGEVPTSSKDLRGYLFGSANACQKCSSVTKEQIAEVEKKLLDIQNETRESKLRDLFEKASLKNLVAVEDTLNLPDEKLSCIEYLEEKIWLNFSSALGNGKERKPCRDKIAASLKKSSESKDTSKLITKMMNDHRSVAGQPITCSKYPQLQGCPLITLDDLKRDFSNSKKYIIHQLSQKSRSDIENFCDDDQLSGTQKTIEFLDAKEFEIRNNSHFTRLVNPRKICATFGEFFESRFLGITWGTRGKSKKGKKKYSVKKFIEAYLTNLQQDQVKQVEIACRKVIKKSAAIMCESSGEEKGISEESFVRSLGSNAIGPEDAQSPYDKLVKDARDNPEEQKALKALVCSRGNLVRSSFEKNQAQGNIEVDPDLSLEVSNNTMDFIIERYKLEESMNVAAVKKNLNGSGKTKDDKTSSGPKGESSEGSWVPTLDLDGAGTARGLVGKKAPSVSETVSDETVTEIDNSEQSLKETFSDDFGKESPSLTNQQLVDSFATADVDTSKFTNYQASAENPLNQETLLEKTADVKAMESKKVLSAKDIMNDEMIKNDEELKRLQDKISQLEEKEQERVLAEAQKNLSDLQAKNDLLKKENKSLLQNQASRSIASVPQPRKKNYSSPSGYSSDSVISNDSKAVALNKANTSLTSNESTKAKNLSRVFANTASLKSGSVSSSAGKSSGDYNSALAVVLVDDSTSLSKSLDTKIDSKVSSILSKMIKDEAISHIKIQKINGVETVVFLDQKKQVRLSRFSTSTQKLIRDYEDFAKGKMAEKREEIVLSQSQKASNDVSLNLMKKSFYMALATVAREDGREKEFSEYSKVANKF